MPPERPASGAAVAAGTMARGVADAGAGVAASVVCGFTRACAREDVVCIGDAAARRGVSAVPARRLSAPVTVMPVAVRRAVARAGAPEAAAVAEARTVAWRGVTAAARRLWSMTGAALTPPPPRSAMGGGGAAGLFAGPPPPEAGP